MKYRIATYNVENQRSLYSDGVLVENGRNRYEALANTIAKIQPAIIGIVEGSNIASDHDHFLRHPKLKGLKYKVAHGKNSRGSQELLFYYRDIFEILSIDDTIHFYDNWHEDIDNDTIEEYLKFERKPLEVRFRHRESGEQFLIILVSFKSKGVFTTTDFYRHEKVSLANRKKLYAQSKKVRERLDQLLEHHPNLPVIVMGDINDSPGMDHLEKIIGASAVETIMGNVFHPERIFHNALWPLAEKLGAKHLWTIDFHDPIVHNHKKHREWVDHIFISPGLFEGSDTLRFVRNSGDTATRDEFSKHASDHLPVYCSIEISPEGNKGTHPPNHHIA